ncbi:putative sh3 domain protein [Diplodia seriata]|uniref:Putative sh3 domain protein n=1 Tax=Diplodia seriata TaxID=420778 RepID=A0A0G2FS84_9PEZI|nr:putative sh3 domain protein [Diplodia seriata]
MPDDRFINYTMGIKDTFNFDDAAYEKKLRSMDTTDLRNGEVGKIRQYVAGSIGVGCALGAFPSTMGTSLLLLPLFLRSVNIARRKLNLIRATLFDRGVPPHQLTKRDLVVPLAIRATSLGLGTAVGLFVDITTVTPLEGVAPAPADGFDAAAEVLNTKNPDAMLNGFASGIAEQGNQPVINETVSHAVAASQCGAGHAFDVQDGAQQSGPHHTPDAAPDERTDPAFLTGMFLGARVASVGESKVVSALLSQIPLMILSPGYVDESDQDEAAQLHISCDRCGKTFDAYEAQPWHCSACAFGDFDVCVECYNAGERCLDNKHVMAMVPLQL